MEFTELRPFKHRYKSDPALHVGSIRATFYKIKSSGKFRLTLHIGLLVAQSINILHGDKISISFEKNNNRILLIQKASKCGYKLCGKNKSNNLPENLFCVRIPWDVFQPLPEDFYGKFVKIEKYSNNSILIYL